MSESILETSEKSKKSWFISHEKIIIVLSIAILLLLGGIVFLLFERGNNKLPEVASQITSPAIISGQFDINGVVPDTATITIVQKEHKGNGKTEEVENITPIDHGVWSLNNVEPGVAYEIYAKVMDNDNEVGKSSTITVTAPATNQVLVINLESADNTGSAVISGNIQVNGYIPQGATISVQGRSLGAGNFSTVASNLPGEKRQFMSYTTAVSGRTYEVVGILYDRNRNQIGSSSVLIVTAPAVNELLTINSQALPPATPTPAQVVPTQAGGQSPAVPTPQPSSSVISGSIKFNGVAPPNSRIVIFQKVYNTNNYQVAVDNITPVDGTTWQWNGATPATWYDMIAILKQKQPNGSDQDIADSQVVSVAAPGSNVVFTINSSISLSAPGGPINLVCGNLSGSTWNSQISFTAVNGAGSYWYQIGTSNGGTQLANATANASGNSNLVVNEPLNNGTTYYAQYAYATVPNVGANSPQFSPFSQVTQLRCSQ